MLPKSRRALTIQEIAALARSSLHGKELTSVNFIDNNCDPTHKPSCLHIDLNIYMFIYEKTYKL